jgi:hypothetical protein
VASLGNALADMNKTDGDLLKAQRGVAYWDVYEWSGSLLLMEPGRGYQLKSQAGDPEFSYPSSVVTGTSGSRMANDQSSIVNSQPSMFTPVNFRNYCDNAIMTAKVVANGQPVGNAEVAVFAGDECRTTAMTNEDGFAYLTIPGDETCELTFKVAVGDQVVNVPFTLTFEVDAIFGTANYPVVMNLGDLTGIWDNLHVTGDESVYDLSGRKVANGESLNRKLQKGVYIINGKKKVTK